MRAGALLVDGALGGLARLGRLHPQADPSAHGVEVVRDVPYRPTGLAAHRLDIWRPAARRSEPRPVVLYIHGGGFRTLSKDTHWVMALAYARRGYVVFTIDYRLAPRHKYPDAHEDACAALRWVLDRAEDYGGDADRLVLAGESAGANLITGLAIAASWRRPEPWAREVFEAAPRLLAVLPACGLLQVSDPGRFARRRPLPAFVADRIEEVTQAYLGGIELDGPGGTELADPLVVLERAGPPERPLPPFFIAVGTRDPLLDDSRRLAAALARLGARGELQVYPGEPHAFHALTWRPSALRCWRDGFSFLDGCLVQPADRVA